MSNFTIISHTAKINQNRVYLSTKKYVWVPNPMLFKCDIDVSEDFFDKICLFEWLGTQTLIMDIKDKFSLE